MYRSTFSCSVSIHEFADPIPNVSLGLREMCVKTAGRSELSLVDTSGGLFTALYTNTPIANKRLTKGPQNKQIVCKHNG